MSYAESGRLIGTSAEARDFMPLLRWLIVMSFVAFGVLILVHFGLLQIMVRTDRSRISLLIIAIFIATSVHCLVQIVWVSRELNAVRRVRDAIVAGSRGFQLTAEGVATSDGRLLEPSTLTRHVANLVMKSEAQGGRKVDQTLLLRALADQLKAREKPGWFVAEALLRLALLGTAVGFILMLIPIAGLTAFDVETLRTALAGMSGGMAIALNVTVAGIASALILKIEYYVLDEAISELFHTITEVTEVHVVSALERP